MKLKRQIEQELREAKQTLAAIKKIPCGHTLYHCPLCGNPVLLNAGQEARKLEKGKKILLFGRPLIHFY